MDLAITKKRRFSLGRILRELRDWCCLLLGAVPEDARREGVVR